LEEAVVEYQIASELNPTDMRVDQALHDVRQKLRAKVSVTRGGKTELESLIARTRDTPVPGLELPDDVKLPGSLVFGNGATARAVFLAVGRFANMSVIFDPAFRDQPLSIDLRNASLPDAMTSLTASTHTFYRVTAARTVTIVPDSPAKRREYEESVIRTIYLSNADVKEAIDLLRVVVDIRQISPITGTNSISIKDTPERVAAAVKLIEAIDKARPEVIIDVELLEVDRTKLKEYGLQIASPGSDGINGSADVNKAGLTLADLKNLTAADVFLSGVPGLYYRLLKNDTNTRALANPGDGALRRPHPRAADDVRANRRRRRQHTTDRLLYLREHRREHRHHAADASRRRGVVGVEGVSLQRFRERLRRPADLRQPRDLDDDPPEGRRDEHARRAHPRRRTDGAGRCPRADGSAAHRAPVRQQPQGSTANRHHPDTDAAYRARARSE
jgi:hypothetical protein